MHRERKWYRYARYVRLRTRDEEWADKREHDASISPVSATSRIYHGSVPKLLRGSGRVLGRVESSVCIRIWANIVRVKCQLDGRVSRGLMGWDEPCVALSWGRSLIELRFYFSFLKLHGISLIGSKLLCAAYVNAPLRKKTLKITQTVKALISHKLRSTKQTMSQLGSSVKKSTKSWE